MAKNTEDRMDDWASPLINYLLTVVEEAQEQLPKGFSINGLSLQKHDEERVSINFSFNRVRVK